MHAWPDLTTSGGRWDPRPTSAYHVTPRWVYVQVLRMHHSAPLIARLVWLFTAIQAELEVAVLGRCVLTPMCTHMCRILQVHCSPSAVVVTLLVLCAAYALVTFSFIQQVMVLG